MIVIKKNTHIIYFLSYHGLLISPISYAVSWNLNFAVKLVTSFSRQKTVGIKKKRQNSKFYNPAKFQL